MNKGQSLMEVLVALLIPSIVLVIIIGFIQTGRGVFNKGFQNILIQNDYDKLIVTINKDLKDIKKINQISNSELIILSRDNSLITYKIEKDKNKIKILRQNKELKFKNMKISSIYFEGYDKNERKTTIADKLILIKAFINYLDNKSKIHYNFEIFNVKK